jgi:hypothetical protein
MDEKDFKKHLKDLAHGHHHPEEHDWTPGPVVRASDDPTDKPRKKAAKAKRKSRTGSK